MWIPEENENGQRAPSDQSTQKTGSQKADNRVGLRFPKSIRILTRKHFQQLSATGSRKSGNLVFFQHRKGKAPSRLGITVSKKYGKAHDRNRFKRVVREVFRELYDSLPEGTQLHVSPRLPGSRIGKSALLADFLSFLSLLGKD